MCEEDNRTADKTHTHNHEKPQYSDTGAVNCNNAVDNWDSGGVVTLQCDDGLKYGPSPRFDLQAF